MATITKRATGYQAQIRRKGFPPVSRMFDTRRAAEAWARLYESEMDRGTFLDRSQADRTTLGEVLSRYKADITPKKKSAANEAIRIDRLLREDSICRLKMTALTSQRLGQWRDQRLKEVSGSTVSREIDILSHAINTARKEWAIHIDNPVELIQRPKRNRGRERRLAVVSGCSM